MTTKLGIKIALVIHKFELINKHVYSRNIHPLGTNN